MLQWYFLAWDADTLDSRFSSGPWVIWGPQNLSKWPAKDLGSLKLKSENKLFTYVLATTIIKKYKQ